MPSSGSKMDQGFEFTTFRAVVQHLNHYKYLSKSLKSKEDIMWFVNIIWNIDNMVVSSMLFLPGTSI